MKFIIQMGKGELPPQEIPVVSFTYRLVRWIFGTVLAIFFQEIDVVGKENVPTSGPVIFVGNHPNQFVDGMMMFSQSPRDIFMLIAASSVKNYALEGFFAKLQKAIPVYRREDNAFPGEGIISFSSSGKQKWKATIHKDLPSFISQTIKVGDLLSIPLETPVSIDNENYFKDVRVLISDFDSDYIANVSICTEYQAVSSLVKLDGISSEFKVFPKLDQSKAYEAIFSVLARGDCIGVFPEGGSSDWTQLRKLKVGVAYIALSLKRKHRDLPVTIVPCGLNYISGHRFRSKSLIEFGSPLVISSLLVDKFISGDKAAVELLTDQINTKLHDVTLNIPPCISGMLNISPFEAREIIATARRLYQPPTIQLPVEKYLELNRRFANGFSKISDEPKVEILLSSIRQYNIDLQKLYLTDRQLENSPKNWKVAVWGVWTLLKQIIVLLPFIVALPGFLLHLPIAMLTKWKALSVASKQAARSDVKIEGRDVIASTKIAIGFVMIVVFYLLYAIIAGLLFGWIWAPIAFIGIPLYTYQCIRYMDMAVVTARATIPLVKFLVSRKYRRSCKELVARRKKLRNSVREAVEEYGPRFNEYWDQRVVPQKFFEGCSTRASRPDQLPFCPLSNSYEQVPAKKDMFQGIADDLFTDDELL